MRAYLVIPTLLALGYSGALTADAQDPNTTGQRSGSPNITKDRIPTLDRKCPVSDPAQDYSVTFNVPASAIKILTENVQLARGRMNFLFTDTHSCGSMGCQYVLFEQVGEACFIHRGEFHGHFKILKTTHHDWADIEINHKPDYAVGNIRTVYTFDVASGKYLAVKEAK